MVPDTISESLWNSDFGHLKPLRLNNFISSSFFSGPFIHPRLT
jgi:hypothetical protein